MLDARDTPTLPVDTDEADPATSPSRFFNRELSWLSFNERVLAEAENPRYPLLERLRFLSISGSNIDEFMTVRAAGIAGQIRRSIDEISIDGMTPTQQLAAVHEQVIAIETAQQQVWAELKAELADCGIRVVGDEKLGAAADRWLKEYFVGHIMPVITWAGLMAISASMSCGPTNSFMVGSFGCALVGDHPTRGRGAFVEGAALVAGAAERSPGGLE
jgi:polyphosphate kinase